MRLGIIAIGTRRALVSPLSQPTPHHKWAKRALRSHVQQLTLVADGVPLTLPSGTEGVIVLNIASYGGGSDLW